MCRGVYQTGMRVMQGIKDQAFNCDATINSFKDSTNCGGASASRTARKLSAAVDSTAFQAAANCGDVGKARQAEDSLRTVLYLSCWGPN